MNWILWREYRLNRHLLIAGAVLLIVPYPLACLALFATEMSLLNVFSAMVLASAMNIFGAQVIAAVLGGNAIAGEHVDQSAQFIAYLPVSRLQRLTCKLILCASTVLVHWGINVGVLGFLKFATFDEPFPMDYAELYGATKIGVVFFCVAWFASSFNLSPTIATLFGLATPLFVAFAVFYLLSDTASPLRIDGLTVERADSVFYTSNYIIAAICLALGCWNFLRRVEP